MLHEILATLLDPDLSLARFIFDNCFNGWRTCWPVHVPQLYGIRGSFGPICVHIGIIQNRSESYEVIESASMPIEAIQDPNVRASDFETPVGFLATWKDKPDLLQTFKPKPSDIDSIPSYRNCMRETVRKLEGRILASHSGDSLSRTERAGDAAVVHSDVRKFKQVRWWTSNRRPCWVEWEQTDHRCPDGVKRALS